MSEVFDPEKVERRQSCGDGTIYNAPDEMVDASDYDQLLEMYQLYRIAFADVMEVEFNSNSEHIKEFLDGAKGEIERRKNGVE